VLVRLLCEPAFLAACSEEVLTDDEQALLAWPTPPRGPGSARWSAADVVLLDEIGDLMDRRHSLGHVILDEAQDLSPMQLRAVGRRASTGSVTVLGDIAQGTTPWATASWAESLTHLGKPDAVVEVLDRGYRVPALVIDFASRLLPRIAPDVAPPVSVRDNPGLLELVATATDVDVAGAVRAALALEGSVGLIAADASIARLAALVERDGLAYDLLGRDEDSDARLVLVPASLAKGLEFDHVVVLEPADIVAAEGDEHRGLRRLYVVLTRAVSGLTVVHGRPLPAPLDGVAVA
jgi:DNA helicase IV